MPRRRQWERKQPALALAPAVMVFGLLLTGACEASDPKPGSIYPVPVPTPDVIWGPPTAPQRGFGNAPAPRERRPLPEVNRQEPAELVAKPGPARLLYVATVDGALQMRTEPSPDAASRGTYPRGTPMIILEDMREWMRVLAPDGRWGWMAAEFLSETATQEEAQ